MLVITCRKISGDVDRFASDWRVGNDGSVENLAMITRLACKQHITTVKPCYIYNSLQSFQMSPSVFRALHSPRSFIDLPSTQHRPAIAVSISSSRSILILVAYSTTSTLIIVCGLVFITTYLNIAHASRSKSGQSYKAYKKSTEQGKL